jgi:MFS transporter, DHA1 family, inner membrane transport protein
MDQRLLVLALGMFAIGTDSFVVAGILPDVARGFDLPLSAAGLLITVYALAYGLMTPVMAALTAHWPRKRTLLAGLAVFVIGNLLTAVLSRFELAVASRAIAGLGGAIFTPAAGAAAAALVPPERRGRALAVVIAGLSGATALGSPIGTMIGTLSTWHTTMWFVAALGALAACGVATALPALPAPPPVGLRTRLAPLLDFRVAATLATTLLAACGLYVVYSYISTVFDRATAGSGFVLAALLSVWGVSATVGNLAAGSLVDRFGNRSIINLAIVVVALDFALMPWASAGLSTTVVTTIVWGVCGWGLFVGQQHRLIGMAPALAPLLLALNASATYVGASIASAAGALAMLVIEPRSTPLLGGALLLTGLLAAELAHRWIARSASRATAHAPATDEKSGFLRSRAGGT